MTPDTFLFLFGLRREYTPPVFNQKRRRRARQSQQRREASAEKEGGLSTRPQNSPNKAQRGPGGETGNKGKDSPQLFTTAWS